MAEFKELILAFKAVRDALPEVLPQAATSVSMAGKALAERTVKDKGFGEEYSTTKVPAWFMKGKELNKRGANYITGLEKRASKEDKLALSNWGDFRQAQGLQINYVDLTYSGEMWRGLFPQDVQIEGFSYIAPLGSTTVAGQKKLNWQYERYGNFFAKVLTGDNLDAMYKVAFDELVRLLDEKIQFKK